MFRFSLPLAVTTFALTFFASDAFAARFECRPLTLSERHGKIERRILKAIGDSLRVQGLSDFTIKVTKLAAEQRVVISPRSSFDLRIETEVTNQTDAGSRVGIEIGQGVLRSDFLESCTAVGRYGVRIVFNPTTTGVARAQRQVVEKVVRILQPGKLMESRN